jgi:hypothetical protein
MDFALRFTDKEITAWGGRALMKRMLWITFNLSKLWRRQGYPSRAATGAMCPSASHHTVHAQRLVQGLWDQAKAFDLPAEFAHSQPP